jgi:hypothetical protein
MSLFCTTPGSWLLRTALGGGLLLLLVGAAVYRVRAPARRQRLAELGLAAALLVALLSLGPAWWRLPLGPDDTPALAVTTGPPKVGPPAADTDDPPPALAGGEVMPWPQEAGEAAPAPELPEESPAAEPHAQGNAGGESWLTRDNLKAALAAAFALGSGVLLTRWLLGYLALWRLLRGAGPAPAWAARLFASMAGRAGRPPRLLVSRRLRVPISCGLWRPTVVLPVAVVGRSDGQTLRWIFAHELTHLERRDAWSCLLFGLGQAIYFYLPWFWGLRRQVRLCQEYIADAAAIAQEASAADYAEFLLKLTRAPALPVGATGVLGHSSDLFRRVSMLLQETQRVEKSCPRRWSLTAAGGLLGLAVLAAGVGLGEPTAEAGQSFLAAAPDDQAGPKPVPQQAAPKRVIVIRVRGEETGGDKKTEGKGVIVLDGKVIQVPGGAVVIDPAKLAEMIKAKVGKVDVKQVHAEVERALRELKKKHAILIKLAGAQGAKTIKAKVGQVDVKQVQAEVERALGELKKQHAVVIKLAGTQGADVEKHVAKALAQLKAQQGSLAGLHKVLGQQGVIFSGGGVHGIRLGVTVNAPGRVLTDQLDLPKGKGLVVEQVVPRTPAAKAGLRANDILLEVNGHTLASNQGSLNKALDSVKANSPFEVVILRKGKKETLKGVTLAERKKSTFNLVRPGTGNFRLQGPAGFGGGFGVGFGGQGGNTVLTTVMRRGDHFTTRHQEGSLIITLTGTVTDGRAKLGEIHVQDGGKEKTYRDVDGVPERYRDKVKNLLEMSEKGKVKVEVEKK